MTLTAIRPDCGLSNGREVLLLRVAQASALISALRVVLRALWGVVGSKKIGVAYGETLFVVVSIDKPAGDAVSIVATDFAGVRMEHVHAMDSDLCPVASGHREWEIRTTQVLECSERFRPLSIRPTSPA